MLKFNRKLTRITASHTSNAKAEKSQRHFLVAFAEESLKKTFYWLRQKQRWLHTIDEKVRKAENARRRQKKKTIIKFPNNRVLRLLPNKNFCFCWNFRCHKLFQVPTGSTFLVSKVKCTFRRAFIATSNCSVSFASLIDLMASACTINHSLRLKHFHAHDSFLKTSFKALMHFLCSKLSVNMFAHLEHLSTTFRVPLKLMLCFHHQRDY